MDMGRVKKVIDCKDVTEDIKTDESFRSLPDSDKYSDGYGGERDIRDPTICLLSSQKEQEEKYALKLETENPQLPACDFVVDTRQGRRIDCYEFNENNKSNKCKQEPGCPNSEIDFKDHNNRSLSSQFKCEEDMSKLYIPGKFSTDTLECKTEQMKCEDDMSYKDIKTELVDENSSESDVLTFCEMCNKCFTRKSDFISHKNEGCSSQLLKNDANTLNDIQDPGLRLFPKIKDEIDLAQDLVEEQTAFYDYPMISAKDGDSCEGVSSSVGNDEFVEYEETNEEESLVEIENAESSVPNTNSKDVKSYQSKFCNKSFSYLGNLRRHEEIHNMPRSMPLQCEIQAEEKPFQCEICLKHYARLYDLKKHKQRHLGKKPFQCSVCLKYFSQASYLKDHEKMHTGQMPFQCEVCLKSFVRLSQLKYHEAIHGEESPSQCEICLKQFSRVYYLKEHRKLHSEEKPYQCRTCPMSFARTSYLKEHEKTHSEEKPFKCEICQRTFSQPRYLKYHENIHTDQFQCKICLKTFSRSPSMRKHEILHKTGKL